MPQSFPADLRILQSVSTVLGADDSLESINTHKVSNRAIVMCIANDSLYVLRRESTATPSGEEIVEPSAGPGRWFIFEPGGAGGAFDPIQNVRWLDPDSAVTPENGSIRAPFTDVASFLDEVDAGGWKLMLPTGTTFAFTIGDQPAEADVSLVFEGLADNATSVGVVSVVDQTSATLALTFQRLQLEALSTAASLLDLSFESCEVHACDATGTVGGTVRFVNCDVWDFGLDTMDASFESCTLGIPSGASTISVGAATIRACTFRQQTTLRVRTSATITDTIFGTGCIIDVNANQPIIVDPFSYAQIIAHVTQSDTIPDYTLMPWVPYIKEIIGESFDVNPNSTSQRDLGPFLLAPEAQGGGAGGLCLVQFKSPSPNGARLVCVAAALDPAGHILVDVMNVSLTATQSATDPVFVVTYLPTLAPNL